jgi:hypothetical protein
VCADDRASRVLVALIVGRTRLARLSQYDDRCIGRDRATQIDVFAARRDEQIAEKKAANRRGALHFEIWLESDLNGSCRR